MTRAEVSEADAIVRPLTHEESKRMLALVQEADALRGRIRDRVGGPLPSSVDTITWAREERSREI
jgi:hypothetical protein